MSSLRTVTGIEATSGQPSPLDSHIVEHGQRPPESGFQAKPGAAQGDLATVGHRAMEKHDLPLCHDCQRQLYVEADGKGSYFLVCPAGCAQQVKQKDGTFKPVELPPSHPLAAHVKPRPHPQFAPAGTVVREFAPPGSPSARR